MANSRLEEKDEVSRDFCRIMDGKLSGWEWVLTQEKVKELFDLYANYRDYKDGKFNRRERQTTFGGFENARIGSLNAAETLFNEAVNDAIEGITEDDVLAAEMAASPYNNVTTTKL